MREKIKNCFATPKKRVISICVILLAVLGISAVATLTTLAVSKNNAIGKDEACAYAYADAGVNSSDVSYVSVEFDYDYGQFVYDVEFIANQVEYEYVIKASDGSVIKKETDIDDVVGNALSTTGADTSNETGSDVANGTNSTADTNITNNTDNAANSSSDATNNINSNATTSNSTDSYISVDSAKAIALNHAGLSESEVTFVKTKLERDDGIMEYEIEFYKDRMEYEYTINAVTGDILEYDVDMD